MGGRVYGLLKKCSREDVLARRHARAKTLRRKDINKLYDHLIILLCPKCYSGMNAGFIGLLAPAQLVQATVLNIKIYMIVIATIIAIFMVIYNIKAYYFKGV